MKVTQNPLKNAMAERLKKAREKAGLTQQGLVDRVNASEKAPPAHKCLTLDAFKKWEGAVNYIPTEWIPALCDVLGVDVGYLFGEYDEQTRTASDVCAVTGLSEQALKTLQSMKLNYPNYLRVLNFLLYECNGYIHHLLSRILLCSEKTLEYQVGNKRNIEAAKLAKKAARLKEHAPERADELRKKAASVHISNRQLNSVYKEISVWRYEAQEEFTRIMDVCAKPENGLIPYDE